MTDILKENLRKMVARTNRKRASRILNAIDTSKDLPREIFDSVLRLIPGSSLEVVPFYLDENERLNVFLTQRSPKDRFWPNKWHCPGTMILDPDEVESGDFSKPWERLRKNEFMQDSIGNPVKVSDKLINTERGKEVALIHYVEVPGNLRNGRYFSVDELPSDLVAHHHLIISEAVRAYNRIHEK